MSGFNPLAAAGAALQQSSLAAIDLGVAIEILQAQLTVGDLLTATILPPQGGVDRLLLLGQTVLAQLPPGINPGESLLLQVSGFTGNQIVVRNLGTVDPANPPPTAQIELPPLSPGAPVQATLTTVISNSAQAATPNAPAIDVPAAASPSPAGPAPATALAPGTAAPPPGVVTTGPAAVQPGAVAPPRAVFVAASVQPAPPGGAATWPPGRPAATGAWVVHEEQAATQQLGLEARIAAARAASLDLAGLVNTPARSGSPPAPSVLQPATASDASSAPNAPKIAPDALPTAPATGGAPVPTAAAATSPEEVLLAQLRVAVGPLTLAAARLAANAATALPRALARLDAALAGVAAQDPRAGSLRASIAFLTRLDPGNVRALPEQLMSFVNNVVGGAESKLAAVLRILVASAQEETPSSGAPEVPGSAAPAVPGTQLASLLADDPVASPVPVAVDAEVVAAPAPAQSPALSPGVAAHLAERMTALQYDVKAAIVALSESLPRGASAQLAPALNDALTAVTAMQLNVLGAQMQIPTALTIPLPVFFHANGQPVQLRIARDAPKGGKLDADNFHIAFVLDTRSLGVVAVDMQTVGRTVSVSVKTEAAPAAGRFRATLDDLRQRLEHLHYRIANIAAGVAPRRFGAAPEPSPPATPSTTHSSVIGLDMRA